MNFHQQTYAQINSSNNVIFRTWVKQFDASATSGLSIKMPLNGEEYYYVNNREFCVAPGSFLLVPAGTDLRCIVDAKHAVHSLCIYLDAAIFDDFQDELFQGSGKKEDISDSFSATMHPLAGNPLSLSLRQWGKSAKNTQLIEENYLQLAEQLSDFLRVQHTHWRRIEAKSKATKSELLHRLQIAEAFIYDNYQQDISLDDIARVAMLSKFHLLRHFKQVYKETPYQLLLKTRLEKAKSLLDDSSCIEEVGIRCGFTNRRSFSRAFKRLYGYSPSHMEAAS